MRTRILCLNSIEGPERVRYSYCKAQELKGNLVSFLTEVLSGTCDFRSIKGNSKEYFAEFLKGKKTIQRGFISFLRDLLYIEELPLPSSSSVKHLYLIYQKKIDFISIIQDYSRGCNGIIAKNLYWKIFYKVSSNCDSEEFIDFIQKGEYFISLLNEYYNSKYVLITNNSLWERFYNAFINYSYEEIQEFFYRLTLLSSKDNLYLWKRFPLKVIWDEIFNDGWIDEKTFYRLLNWKQFLLRFPDEKNFGRSILYNKDILGPIQPKAQKLFSRLIPVLFNVHYRGFDNVIRFFNSDYFIIPEYIAKISGFIHLLINLLKDNWKELRTVLEVFIETDHDFYRFILYNQPVSKINYLKYLIKKVIRLWKSNPKHSGYCINNELLVTLYIISSYNEKIINPIESLEKRANWYSVIFTSPEYLFISLFVKYETPWYFIENLTHLTHRDLNILFQLLKGKNLKCIVKPSFPVTNKDIHRFIFYPRFLVKFCDDVVNTGLFWSKFDNFTFHENIHFPLNDFFRKRILITQVINDFQFWFEILNFFKKNELLIQYTQVGPLLDYFVNQRYQRGYTTNFQINGRSLNRILNDMEQWHLNLHQQNIFNNEDNKAWTGHAISNFNIELEGISYSIIQLRSDEELFTEGKTMNHCVYSYRNSCYDGSCSIWSLRREEINGVTTRLATIEIRNNTIIQVRRKNNILPGKLEENIIAEWSDKAGLGIDYL